MEEEDIFVYKSQGKSSEKLFTKDGEEDENSRSACLSKYFCYFAPFRFYTGSSRSASRPHALQYILVTPHTQ
jgi:hypothetical protein